MLRSIESPNCHAASGLEESIDAIIAGIGQYGNTQRLRQM
jgi:hypothetical protein